MGLVLPSGQKLTLGLLATNTLNVVPFSTYALFPALLPILNASWWTCSVRVFSTACNSASITSIVSKCPNLQLVKRGKVAGGQVSQVGWVGGHLSLRFWSEISWCKRKCETVHCPDATAGSFVAKNGGKFFAHFHTGAIKHHSSVCN
jgi:hypothetical protein